MAKILVVTSNVSIDDMDTGVIVVQCLRRAGHNVWGMCTGKTKEEVMLPREGLDGADLLIIDYKLGVANGLKVVSQLRASELCPPQVIVICDEATEFASARCLTKPFTLGELRACVEKALATPPTPKAA